MPFQKAAALCAMSPGSEAHDFSAGAYIGERRLQGARARGRELFGREGANFNRSIPFLFFFSFVLGLVDLPSMARQVGGRAEEKEEEGILASVAHVTSSLWETFANLVAPEEVRRLFSFWPPALPAH